MFRKPAWNLKIKPTRLCLSELDCLYKETVSELPICVRSAYCESLIYRTQLDLECASNEDQRETLTQLVAAAQEEISLLSGIGRRLSKGVTELEG